MPRDPRPPIHPEGWTSTAANGCTAPGCGAQDTDQLCGCHGRRCPEHAAHEETEQ